MWKRLFSRGLRRVLVVVLIVAVALSVPTTAAFAASPGSQTAFCKDKAAGGDVPDPKKNKYQDDDPSREDASFITRMIGDLIAGLAWGLKTAGNATGIVDINTLVFGCDEASVALFGTNDQGQSEFTAVEPLYTAFSVLAWTLMVFVVMQAGMRIARGKSNPRVRSSIGETATNVGIGIVLLCFSWVIVYYASDWNIALCQWVQPDARTVEAATTSGDYVVNQLVNLIMTVMSLFLNVLYVLRKFLLIGAVVVAPFVAVAYAGGHKQPFSIWLSETVSNALIPFSHALVLSLYDHLKGWSGGTAGLMGKWWVPIVMLFMLFPVSSYFRRLFSSVVGTRMGMNEESVAAGGLSGLAGAASMVGSLAGAFGGGGMKAGKAALGAAKGTLASRTGNLSGGAGAGAGAGAVGSGSAAGASAPASASADAGAFQRSSSPTAIQTGIGQASPMSQEAAQNSMQANDKVHTLYQAPPPKWKTAAAAVGSGALAGGKAAMGQLPKLAGQAVGAALDLGMQASGVPSQKFRESLGKAGERAAGAGAAVWQGGKQAVQEVRNFAQAPNNPVRVGGPSSRPAPNPGPQKPPPSSPPPGAGGAAVIPVRKGLEMRGNLKSNTKGPRR